MERTHRQFAANSFGPVRCCKSGSARFDPLNPASRQANRSLRAAEYDQFARSIRRDLNPRGPLETLVARHAVRSAWRLRENLGAEADASGSELSLTAADRAARSLEVAITTLDLLQGRRDQSVEPLLNSTDQEASLESNEWPVVPTSTAADSLETPDEDVDDDAPIWRDRLVYDFDVSDRSPVIRGTWITVSHVVSLIVDGATWAEILRTHPELTEADIRVCVAYAVAEDSALI